jgi:ribosomal protein S18 acetylase RimI-like enzyme
MSDYRIRPASAADVDTIIEFTLHEAREAEGLVQDRAVVERGVRGAFEIPPRSTYWVVETTDGRVVASTSIVTEWSDFHGGAYWWVQSLFILPQHRGGGLVQRIMDHLAAIATAAGALDLRLYAHSANERAVRAYKNSGFSVAPYTIMTRSLTSRRPD